jgi:lipopolysaccharide transport system permease protein
MTLAPVTPPPRYALNWRFVPVSGAAAAGAGALGEMTLSGSQDRGSEQGSRLTINDTSRVPLEPPSELLYSHSPHLWRSARRLFGRWDVILTLAERDIRAQYKQAILGIGWAFVNPVVTLVVFNLVFSHVPSFKVEGQPQILFLYLGIITWSFFSTAVLGASGSLLTNKTMMAKTHFPRECFPLAYVVESAFSTVLASTALLFLFAYEGFLPKLGTVWVPLYVAVEIPFTIGIALLLSSVIIQMRDLNQTIPIFIPLAMLATPVVWPFSKVPTDLQPLYSFFNPIGPVINCIRGSVLQNHAPEWGLLAVATVGSLLYLFGGYTVFKRLEVNFADLA